MKNNANPHSMNLPIHSKEQLKEPRSMPRTHQRRNPAASGRPLNPLLSVALAAAVGWVANVSSAGASPTTILYFDPINGADDETLTGSPPSQRRGGVGSEFWTSGVEGEFRADGNVMGSGNDAVFLPFAPQQGMIYTLSADIDTTDGSGEELNWISLGFAAMAGNDAFNDFSVNGYGTMIVRQVRGPDGGSFAGVRHEGSTNPFFTTEGPQEIKIVLDASDPVEANWTVEFFNNGESVGGPMPATEGSLTEIRYAGFTRIAGACGSVKNFKLIAEPAP
jgi:hypothetical protein